MSKATKIILLILITAIIFGLGVYYWQRQKYQTLQTAIKESPASVMPAAETAKNFSTITIVAPKDYDLYKKQMTEFAQAGGEDPLKTTEFVKKELTIPYTADLIRASADAAAKELSVPGGQSEAKVEYLKVQNSTAYILLNIDIDGWAGVSVSLAIIHPVVEKTLLQFPEINNVVFGYAPGYKLNDASVINKPAISDDFYKNSLKAKIISDSSKFGIVESICCENFNKLEILYGDVTDDNEEDAVVAIPSGGTAGNLAVLVYSIVDKQVTLIDTIKGYKIVAEIKNNKLIATTPYYRETDAHCCPSFFNITTYTWNGEKFEALNTERVSFEELNKN